MFGRCCGYNFSGDICDSGFSEIEDAEFLREVSASHGKSKSRMHSLFLLGGSRELNSKNLLTIQKNLL